MAYRASDDENAQAAAVKRSLHRGCRCSGPENAQAFGGAYAVGLAGKRGAKTFQMNAVGKIEIRGQHGAVKGGQAQLIEQAELDAGQIAVGEEWLGMRGDGFEIQAIEQIVRSVAAAQGT